MVRTFKPMYKKIETYIIDQIRSGNWKPGSRIPSENELAEQFSVSRITVKNALTALVDKGVVYRLQGKGTFVNDHSPEEIHNITSAVKEQLTVPTIGFLLPRLDNRFTANLLSGIEDTLSENGYQLLFAKTNDSQETEILKIQEMKQAGVRGLIIYPVEGEHYNNEILALTLNRFPLVLLDRNLKGVETNSISSDNHEAAIQAVKHLHELGHNRIGFISTLAEGTSSIEDRLHGYEKALEDRHILIDRSIQMTRLAMSASDEEVIMMIQKFLQANPQMTALLSSNFSPHVIQAAMQMGISVPEDLSVVFFDDVEFPDFCIIPPTAVVQQELELGREAGRVILKQVENPNSEYLQVKLPTMLIPRQSTAKAKS
ncbi:MULTISPECIES: GntR family transcriptional regulator [unclassified Paenibacillus]|uniref:GntR family transcriptional regulator n=2 Tax=Paenibacillus TaxID=44249 RepID=UPI0009A72F78|nr:MULTISPECIES: GntR family transcriptional regulator [unclassified Paenibacillus]SLK09986.1 transcriptional regulator, GntR family [Paenibacillus sp. RU5A]SOC71815.1 transcriptional regulator, GntR family [Paenibacillus sp. RU26A]SOC74171.1 transcriptional regulator, GntR family [Paenibacillus sp. RU5M]